MRGVGKQKSELLKWGRLFRLLVLWVCLGLYNTPFVQARMYTYEVIVPGNSFHEISGQVGEDTATEMIYFGPPIGGFAEYYNKVKSAKVR